PYVDFPLAEVVKGSMFYIGLCALFFVSLIPLIFLYLTGLSLTQKKNNFHAAASISLLSLWLVSLISLGVVVSKLVSEYQKYIKNNIQYKMVSNSFDLKDFTGIETRNGNTVTISQGDTFSVSVSAKAKDLGNLNAHVEKGVLVLEKNQGFKICVFCYMDSAHF